MRACASDRRSHAPPRCRRARRAAARGGNRSSRRWRRRRRARCGGLPRADCNDVTSQGLEFNCTSIGGRHGAIRAYGRAVATPDMACTSVRAAVRWIRRLHDTGSPARRRRPALARALAARARGTRVSRTARTAVRCATRARGVAGRSSPRAGDRAGAPAGGAGRRRPRGRVARRGRRVGRSRGARGGPPTRDRPARSGGRRHLATDPLVRALANLR